MPTHVPLYNGYARLLDRLSPPLRTLVAQVVGVAHAHACPTWLVGGVVRDVMLGTPVERDLDLAVEGDAIALAHAIAGTLQGHVVASYEPFGTATVELVRPRDEQSASTTSDTLLLDLATTRTETYPHPAALPVVKPATIADDLVRRDFSINAMALALDTSSGTLQSTTLLDPSGGQRDLEAGILRVLHDQSFDDDPTRIVRGLRLAARLDLRFEPHTLELLQHALARERLQATSADRVRTELCLALEEPRPDEVLRLADEHGITPHIFAPLHWKAAMAEMVRQVKEEQASDASLRCAGVLTYPLAQAEREAFITRYRLATEEARLLRAIGTVRSHMDTLSDPQRRTSEIDEVLRQVSDMALDIVRLAEPSPSPIRDTIARYQAARRSAQPHLDGNALQRMGVAPGPHMGTLLRGLRAARLDGLVSSEAEEREWVQQHPLYQS
jgi:tRNA nucleotidyltransferase (CCA-adding enzyme)